MFCVTATTITENYEKHFKTAESTVTVVVLLVVDMQVRQTCLVFPATIGAHVNVTTAHQNGSTASRLATQFLMADLRLRG